MILVLTATASACSDDSGDDFAARVGEVEIPRSEFDAEIDALLSSDEFREQLVDQGVEPTAEGPAPNFVATWLSRRIYQVAADAEFERRGLEVTDELRDAARLQVGSLFGGVDVLETIAAELRRGLVERSARTLALGEALFPDPAEPTEDEVRDAYNNTFGQECTSGREVSHILVETAEEAEDILEDIRGGAEFQALAIARSIDTTTADGGGALGCLVEGAYVAPFEEAAANAPLDEPVGPVETTFGHHVVLATRHDQRSYEEARDDVVERLRRDAQANVDRVRATSVGGLLRQRLAEVGVAVSSRYGTWVADDARVMPADGPGVTTSTAADDHQDEG